MKKVIFLFFILLLIIPLSLTAQKKKFEPEKSEEKEKVDKTEPEKKPVKKAEEKKKEEKKEEKKEKKAEPAPAPKQTPATTTAPAPKQTPATTPAATPAQEPAKKTEAPKPAAVTSEPALVPVKIEEKTQPVEKKVEPEPAVVSAPAKSEEPVKKAPEIKSTPEIKTVPEKAEPVQKKAARPVYINQNSTTKMAFVYAGMPSTAYGTGLIMGGNASNESAFYFEGVKIPFSHHLMTEKPVINNNLLKETYVLTGAFGPEVGDSTGGIINLSLRKPRADKIGGIFDLSMFGASLMVEGPISNTDSFSASFDYGSDDLFTRLAYENENSIATQNNLGGHIRYIHDINDNNSITLNIIGARDSLYYLSSYKKNGTPNLGKSLSPETMFILAKGDYDYKSCIIDSKFTGSFTLSSWDYSVYKGSNFSTIDNRGTVEEHLSWKINDNNRFDFGLVFMAGLFSTDTVNSLLPLEGEPGIVRTSLRLSSRHDIGYIQPSLYLKYRLFVKGFEAVPGVYISGDFHNKEEWSGTVDPRLFLSYNIKEIVKIYAVGGLYSKRPQYDISAYELGNEALTYEKSVHAKLGAALEYKGVFADASGFYKYFYDLIRRNPDTANDYENTGLGWAAGTEIKLGYKNRELDGWVSYSFVKSIRQDTATADERSSDGDIPHIFKAAFAYNFLKNWTVSADVTVTSGTVTTDYTGTQLLADQGIYMPLYNPDDVNGTRLSNTVGYGFRLEYLLFLKALKFGIYADLKGTSSKVDSVYNSDYTDNGALYLSPVLGTAGIRGDF